MKFSYALLQIYNQLKFYMDAVPAILGGQFDNFTYNTFISMSSTRVERDINSHMAVSNFT